MLTSPLSFSIHTGPWHLGRWSRPINAVACAWWLLIFPALCFPAVRGADLTPQTMNWTCLIYGGAMTLAMVYYVVSARTWFKGPRINVEHTRGARVLEGREGGDGGGVAREDNGMGTEKKAEKHLRLD